MVEFRFACLLYASLIPFYLSCLLFVTALRICAKRHQSSAFCGQKSLCCLCANSKQIVCDFKHSMVFLCRALSYDPFALRSLLMCFLYRSIKTNEKKILTLLRNQEYITIYFDQTWTKTTTKNERVMTMWQSINMTPKEEEKKICSAKTPFVYSGKSSLSRSKRTRSVKIQWHAEFPKPLNAKKIDTTNKTKEN